MLVNVRPSSSRPSSGTRSSCATASSPASPSARRRPCARPSGRSISSPTGACPRASRTLDLIPRLVKEPDYLQKEQIRVLTGSFNGPEIDSANIDWRQADAQQAQVPPGSRARRTRSGLVRLDMPNEHGVYMHDTPMKPLFGQRAPRLQRRLRARAGRVHAGRVGRALRAGLGSAGTRAGNRRRRPAVDVTLTRPVPVYFTYITAWAETDGRIVLPAGHLRPRRRARPDRRPRARPQRRPRPRGRWRPDRRLGRKGYGAMSSRICRRQISGTQDARRPGSRRGRMPSRLRYRSGRAISGGTSR